MADTSVMTRAPQADDGDRPAPAASPRTVGPRDVARVLWPYRRRMLLALALGLAGTACGALQPRVVSRAVETFDGGLPRSTVVLMVGLLVGGALFTNAQQLVLERSGEEFAFDTRKRLVRHVFALPMGVIERRDRADLVSRVTTDVSQVRHVMSAGFVELATSLVAVVVSVVMMALIDGLLLGLTAGAIVAALVAVVLIGRHNTPVGLRMQDSVGRLAGSVSRSLGSMRTIRATCAAGREADASVERAREVLAAGYAGATLRAAIQTFVSVTVQVMLIVIVPITTSFAPT